MEELVLTDPVVKPEEIKSHFRVTMLSLNHEITMPPEAVPGRIDIQLRDNLGGYYSHSYSGETAQDYIKFINTGNFTVKSLHKRILERLSMEGILPGTVTGAPEPPVGEL